MNSTPDRPPLLRFLVMFALLLAGATGLAALSHSVPADGDVPAEPAEARVVPASNAERARPAELTLAEARGPGGQP